MKNYSVKAYRAYARKLLEGDVVEDNPIDPKFKTLIVGASGSVVGALACLAYMKNMFRIEGWQSLGNWIKDTAGTAGTDTGMFKSVFLALGNSIAGAFAWASNLVRPLTDWAPGLGHQIGSSQYTYGSVLSLAAVAAALAFVLIKVYKVINRAIRVKTESISHFRARQSAAIKKALTECNKNFAKLRRLSEGGETETAAKEAQGIIATAWNWLKEKVGQIWELARIHYVISIMLLVVTAAIACWYGVKKYQERITDDMM